MREESFIRIVREVRMTRTIGEALLTRCFFLYVRCFRLHVLAYVLECTLLSLAVCVHSECMLLSLTCVCAVRAFLYAMPLLLTFAHECFM